MEIEHYTTSTGRPPVLEWIEDMTEEEQALALGYIDLLAYLGFEVRMPLVKPLGDKLYELRWRARNKQLRILYFAASGGKFVLLHAFTKKQRTTPQKEKEIALRRMRDYKRRYGE